MIIETENELETIKLGQKIGYHLKGGQIIELIGDVGSGKTTLTKGIADGLGIKETVSSPSFTISRQYRCRDSLVLAHYDFYRLDDPGIMSEELKESIGNNDIVTVIEWGDVVKDVLLPAKKTSITISSISENVRQINISPDMEIK